jgi:hypothetical protein
MRKVLGKIQRQRAQVLITFAILFTIITIMGVMVVDFSLWYSERRGAQTDADLPALAGARECMLTLATGVNHDPTWAVDQWFRENVPLDDSGNPDPQYSYTSTPCYDPFDNGTLCVDVVVKHESQNLFSRLSFVNHVFDGVAGNIGAHARACAGAAESSADTLPANPSPIQCFDGGQPDWDHLCWIAGGAHDNDCDMPGNRCWLDLLMGGGACSPGDKNKDIDEMFRYQGRGANCSINPDPPTCDAAGDGWSDCVELRSGNSEHIADAVYERTHLAPCDTNGNGIDDLSEVLDPVTGDATICSPSAPEGQRISPRLISVPVIDQPGEGTCANGEPCPIIAFAAFYIAGCFNDQQDDVEGILAGTTPLTTDQIKCRNNGSPGHQAVLGKWVKLIVSGGGVGPPDDSTTQFSIALCDWETEGSCGGGPVSTPVPWPTSTPLGTPGPTDTPAPTTEPPTPCPTVCNPGGQQCHPECPAPPTNTPQPTPTRTPVPTDTPVPSATPCPPGCVPQNNKCKC